MSRILAYILFTGFCFLAMSSGACAQAEIRVRAIQITGNESLPTELLQAQMTTYATGSFKQKFLRKKPFLYSDEVLQSDIDALVQFYQREGFLYARVETNEVDLDSEDRTVRIHLNVTEGDSITVENVLFALNGTSDTGEPTVDSLLPVLNTVVQTRLHRRFRDADVESDGAMLSRILSNHLITRMYPLVLLCCGGYSVIYH